MFVYYHLEEETKNFGPEYSYYDVCEALLMGTSGYIRIDKPLGTFYLIQNHICDTTTDYSVYTAKLTQYRKAKMQTTLPPCLKFGKNDLGEVPVAKSKKNKKPNFSKKLDKDQTVLKMLRYFNENCETSQTFEIANLEEHFNEEEYEVVKDLLENGEKHSEMENLFEIKVENGKCTLNRKTADSLTSQIIEKLEAETEMKEKLKNMEIELKKKEQELKEEQERKNDVVRQTAEKHQKMMAEKEEKIQKLSKELAEAEKKTENAEKNLQTQVGNLKTENSTKLEKLKAECDAAKSTNKRLEKELEETREGRRIAENRNTRETDEQLREANKKFEKMSSELAYLKNWKNLKTQDIAVMEEQISGLETQLEIAKLNDGEHLVRELQERSNQNEELTSVNNQLESEKREMEDTIRGLIDDIQMAQDNASKKLEEQEKESQAFIESILSMNKELDTKMKEMEEKLEMVEKIVP